MQRIENQEYAEIVALQPKYEWMKCQCELQLDKCMWPGQCDNDIKRYKTNQQATADHTAKMFNHSRTQHLAWGGNPATLGIILPTDYILIDDYPIHPGYRHNKDGYVWMYDGSGWVRQEKIKMTRNEAIEKFNQAYDSKYGQALEVKMIAALEALGLIKFDEITEIDILKHYSDSPNAIIYNLDRGGYKIVKK